MPPFKILPPKMIPRMMLAMLPMPSIASIPAESMAVSVGVRPMKMAIHLLMTLDKTSVAICSEMAS
jgi:hypothetical protein